MVLLAAVSQELGKRHITDKQQVVVRSIECIVSR